ncbi:MAG: type II toxin-antitoxin system RatA family toxin [Magnetococcales bacterium]|nr:type II toxin-antitoxin system RatA family toxin [Magnetococcales bacterium]
MPAIRLSDIVPFQPEQIYQLVADVRRYPEFLPWCTQARVSNEQASQFTAEMVVNFKGFRESFRTIDRLYPHSRIEVRLHSGPFEKLENEWRFTSVQGGTRVDFFIDFQFKSRLLNMTLGPVFAHASQTMLEAFRKRAFVVYAPTRGQI